jgi:cytochrome c-type biogenesis protein
VAELTVIGMSVTDNLYVFAAFGAGVISFVSPCVLPIVPGYLSLVTGLSVGEIREQQRHYLQRIAVNTGLFVLGFTVVFVLLGLLTTAAGSALFRNQETLTRISGGLVLLMACYLAGSQLLTTPRMYQEFRFHPHLDRFGPVAAPVAGAAFGLGWTPCIGPILGSVLGLAARGEDLGRSTVLLVAYSCGLGASFLAVGLAMGKLTRTMEWFKRHSRAITLVSAALLAVFGIVLITDSLPTMTARMSDFLRSNGFTWLVEVG